jgi:hypothetical protein
MSIIPAVGRLGRSTEYSRQAVQVGCVGCPVFKKGKERKRIKEE